jgi:hypothetical protein
MSSAKVLIKIDDILYLDTSAAPAGTIPDGTNTGDIVRWNATTGAWESCAEPFDFQQLNLIPAAAPTEDVEGGLFYKSTDKGIYICTDT